MVNKYTKKNKKNLIKCIDVKLYQGRIRYKKEKNIKSRKHLKFFYFLIICYFYALSLV